MNSIGVDDLTAEGRSLLVMMMGNGHMGPSVNRQTRLKTLPLFEGGNKCLEKQLALQ